MFFNSFEFLLFFIVVSIAYFVLPHRYRWLLLLGASEYFLMAFYPKHAVVVLCVVTLNFVAGLLIYRIRDRRRLLLTIATILANLFILAFFKYSRFIIESLSGIVRLFAPDFSTPALRYYPLPIGMSFYLFQLLSYIIEIHRDKHKPEQNPAMLLLSVMFFPRLVAGPIERPQPYLPQFREKHPFDYQQVTNGLKLMMWGLFKKVVIADRLAVLVDQVYGSPQSYSGLALIIATLFFAYQIYCDFSGYSDMAVGVAQVLGFKLTVNFSQPYFAQSFGDFWQRWHISLSSWIRDYLFFPLTRISLILTKRRFRHLAQLIVSVVVMSLMGLWHGAAWTFVIWGVLHGIYLGGEAWLRTLRPGRSFQSGAGRQLASLAKTGVVFTLVCFAWIFFRAETVPDALYIATHLWSGFGEAGVFRVTLDTLMLSHYAWPLIAVGAVVVVEVIQRNGAARKWLTQKPLWLRWAVYYLLVLTIWLGGLFSKSQFIYLQF